MAGIQLTPIQPPIPSVSVHLRFHELLMTSMMLHRRQPTIRRKVLLLFSFLQFFHSVFLRSMRVFHGNTVARRTRGGNKVSMIIYDQRKSITSRCVALRNNSIIFFHS